MFQILLTIIFRYIFVLNHNKSAILDNSALGSLIYFSFFPGAPSFVFVMPKYPKLENALMKRHVMENQWTIESDKPV